MSWSRRMSWMRSTTPMDVTSGGRTAPAGVPVVTSTRAWCYFGPPTDPRASCRPGALRCWPSAMPRTQTTNSSFAQWSARPTWSRSQPQPSASPPGSCRFQRTAYSGLTSSPASTRPPAASRFRGKDSLPPRRAFPPRAVPRFASPWGRFRCESSREGTPTSCSAPPTCPATPFPAYHRSPSTSPSSTLTPPTTPTASGSARARLGCGPSTHRPILRTAVSSGSSGRSTHRRSAGTLSESSRNGRRSGTWRSTPYNGRRSATCSPSPPPWAPP
mmetsp:Transcript_19366/g.63146  ORF Transcript_19366/g.63146 Transcript_19366/m.63146 type:complete len:273 (+) Transcript_19366:497-1315(+)